MGVDGISKEEVDDPLLEQLREAFEVEAEAREGLMAAIGSHDFARLAVLERAYKEASAESNRILGLRLEEEHREAREAA